MLSLKQKGAWREREKGGEGPGLVIVYFKALLKLQSERTLQKSPRKNDLDNQDSLVAGQPTP